MDTYYAYIRVSTVRQGELGVSLDQQRDAIERYAVKQGLTIKEWFEEQETAAKTGRPIFTRMLKLLKAQRAAGVVMHKIDRSARNLRDWAELGEMIDKGVKVHFANEGLDLDSRGGRLSADIQAVVASDYIRNLREEAKKGFYGRLKQGYYPMPAPVGYLNQGAAKPKIPDPAKAPLVRRVFELYATGEHSTRDLAGKMFRLGLRSRFGKRISAKRIGELLQNPFYIGLIRIAKNGEHYKGAHEPIVSTYLFQEVANRLAGKARAHWFPRTFLFRQLVHCSLCKYALIGETRKSHVYYRCQTPECPTKAIREERLEERMVELLDQVAIPPAELHILAEAVDDIMNTGMKEREVLVKSLTGNLAQIIDRMNRLIDSYVDGIINRDDYEQRKKALMLERLHTEGQIKNLTEQINAGTDKVKSFLEASSNAADRYINGTLEEKRELIRLLTSDRSIACKTIDFTLREPFQVIADYLKVQYGGADGCVANWGGQVPGVQLLKLVDELPEGFVYYLAGSNLPAG